MNSRGSQIIAVVIAIVVGFGSAYAVNRLKNSTAAAPTPTPSVQAVLPTPSSLPSPVETPLASPSSAPSPVPSPRPTPVPTAAASAASGAAPYPPQVTAGTQYPVPASDSRFFALGSDAIDVGSSTCAGINESTQAFPTGYEGSFFVAVRFPDGVTLSVGYLRFQGGPRQDFAEYQRGGTVYPSTGPAGDPTTPGSHTYCLTHGATGWTYSDDGKPIPCPGCPAEAAPDTANAQVSFESSVQYFSGQHTGLTLTVPGFHDILVGGKPPRQLRGTTQAS